MPQIIASTYELQEEIGSGGGGIVYLGRHIRLDKPVVLKADKRTLTAKPETLRREVDALKNLSHSYIPQVYDFVEEEGTVYTVMDFVDGESLDKPLKRGERFSQAQVIEWACQLLEALAYLHSRPPYGILHSDIKPANIMLTPQGDIRLIDFNIALALGEEGSVRVGYSRGYASPEHYGLDYSTSPHLTTSSHSGGDTDIMEDADHPRQSSSSSGSRKRSLLLDVRSDIYSAGATLYHLLTGVRPAVDAKQVMTIHHPDVSPAVAEIISRAMNPDPDRRYQTAQEMLDAFEHLHENDPRTIRHQRGVRITAAVLSAIFLLGGLCAFTGLRQMERTQAAAAEEARIAEEQERVEKQALAAVTASEAAWQGGDALEAIRLAREALSLHTAYDARAQKALTDALGVYDLSDSFRPHLLLELPANPQKAALSPRGTRAAAITSGQMLVFDTESGEQLAALPADTSALSDVVFIGENTVIYAGDGALRAYDLAQGRELWSGGMATAVAVSADCATVAAAYRDDTSATIYDAATGLVRQTVDFQGNRLHAVFNDILADPEMDLFALNADGTHLAVGFSESGALSIYNLADREMDIQIYDQSEFISYKGGFHGQYLAFSGWDGEQSVFAIIDVAGLAQTGGFAQPMRFGLQADESGIYFSAGRLLVWMEPDTFIDHEMAYADDYITDFSVSGNRISALKLENGQFAIFDSSGGILNIWDNQDQGGRFASFVDAAGDYALTASGDAPALRLWRLEDNQKAQVCTYDGSYEHSEARISADGKTVMLFRYDKFRLLDMDGNVLTDVEIPIPEGDQVYDQQYRRDENGSRLEVIYYSGLVRNYSAADGSVISEERVTPPDTSLYEDFLTDHLRIERPLHGTPAAYDRETGELVRELEPEDRITYVTQVGDYVIIEYLSTQTGGHYGLLMDGNLNTLARLPGLCDILEDGRLIFDDMKGNLRQSRIYSAQELMDLAREHE